MVIHKCSLLSSVCCQCGWPNTAEKLRIYSQGLILEIMTLFAYLMSYILCEHLDLFEPVCSSTQWG